MLRPLIQRKYQSSLLFFFFWLFVGVGCRLSFVGCWLLVIGYWLLGYWVLVVVRVSWLVVGGLWCSCSLCLGPFG